jgi:hypothetical protein
MPPGNPPPDPPPPPGPYPPPPPQSYPPPPGPYPPPPGPYPPPPPGPYSAQPPGPYYPPPPGLYAPQAPGTNWWAIISLIFGILGGVLISVICGIVGLRRAKAGQGGRGMAIAGLVLSALWVLVLLVGIAIYFIVGSGTVGANEVKAGDCLKELPDTGLVLTVDTAPCGEPHKGEIFAVMTMPDGDFPGQSAIEKYQNKCAPELAKYSPQAASDPEIGLFVLYPSEDSWGEGDRTVTCIATSEAPRTGTLKD